MNRAVSVGATILAVSVAAASAGPVAAGQGHTPVTVLPENPCDLLTPEQITAAVGFQVIDVRRVPGIGEIVNAQERHREPPAGLLCAYRTRELGDVTIGVPPPEQRTAAAYWDRRDAYFRAFPGSAERIPGLGIDAWLSGGTSISVLAGAEAHFHVSVQHYHPRAWAFLIEVARAAAAKLTD